VVRAACTLLESLVGPPISTVTGRPNTVLRVADDSLVVAASRSQTGSRCRSNGCRAVLSSSLDTGEIEVSVPSLVHRSSFVGANASGHWTAPGFLQAVTLGKLGFMVSRKAHPR
jgi:hypothetical protein